MEKNLLLVSGIRGILREFAGKNKTKIYFGLLEKNIWDPGLVE